MEKDENNSKEISETSGSKSSEESVVFKKPVFVGKIPRKLTTKSTTQEVIPQNDELRKSQIDAARQEHYNEPKWSGLPPSDAGYKLEVLKSGIILETVDLSTRPFHMFGKNLVDIVMAHPTVSRYHAVVQYKAHEESGDDHPVGWYLYDLNSTHGTFLNKVRIKPNHYVRFRVGHLAKFGCSTRQFILQGPDDDVEEESELSLTEMKQERLARKLEIERKMELAKLQEDEIKKKEQESGIDWGMGDDAEEETDLADNPYAITTNEELYLDDPKKTLRGYFEREGVPLEYQCEEKGIGQFLCRVELPIEDMSGRPIIAEVVHKGKKKDAVVQCALEACRVIDRHGLLRQAKHESRKRKEKDWQEIDFYDSDEDTFLDRTGAVEKKREKRIKKYQGDKESQSSKQNDKAFTYDELVKKCESIQKCLDALNQRLETLRSHGRKEDTDDGDEDELDKFMKVLGKQSVKDKAEISKTKMEILSLKQELSKTERLAEIAKPANIPALIKAIDTPEPSQEPTAMKKSNLSGIIGKRIKIRNRIQTPYKEPAISETPTGKDSDEEVESDEEETKQKNDLNCSGIDRLKNDVPNEKVEKTQTIHEKNIDKKEHKEKNIINTKEVNESKCAEKNFGPLRPPEGYVIPEGYFDQTSDRDLPENEEEEVEN